MLDSGSQVVVAAQKTDAADSLAERFARVKNVLRRESGETAFRTWILPIEPVSFDNAALEIAVPTRFIRDWVRTHYLDRIRVLWTQQTGAPCARVDLAIKTAGMSPAAALGAEAYSALPVANENREEKPESPVAGASLDSRYTFAQFVTGPSNELAAAAAKRVAESRETAFNPLFLQGGVGLGKTHLMHAVAWEIQVKDPGRKVVYMSAEKFMYQFVRALRARDTMSFKEYFRGVDVLMIDDIQFICGKESTQEEFFHTFNALMQEGKQVILSADRPPADLDGLDERLKSRMGMGLVASIQQTDYDLRLRILQSKCLMMKRDMPQDVLEFLAGKITASVRELEGALNRLIAHAEMLNRPVTLESTQEILSDLLRAHERRLSIEDIQRRVAEHYSLRMSDILSPRRARQVARPRQVAMYLCKALTQYSLPEIGRKFGGRDHTTIIHGVRKIEELLTSDRDIANDVASLRRALSA